MKCWVGVCFELRLPKDFIYTTDMQRDNYLILEEFWTELDQYQTFHLSKT